MLRGDLRDDVPRDSIRGATLRTTPDQPLALAQPLQGLPAERRFIRAAPKQIILPGDFGFPAQLPRDLLANAPALLKW
jgi:hypothetical protein